MRAIRAIAVAWGLAAVSAALAEVPIPPTCRDAAIAPDDTTPIPEIRKKVEAASETDPDTAVKLMCATIPRVAREYGENSAETAWWVASLATPLIAYRDEFAQAEPLLEFARPVFERRLGPYASEIADIHVAWAWIRFRQGRMKESRAAWADALAVREHTPGARKIELQKVLVGLAQADLSLRDFPAARTELTRAQAILLENGETVSEAAAAIENAFTNLSWREENYVDGRKHAEAQIAIETQMKGGAVQLVPAYVMLGQMLERLDEFEESERSLREALRLSESDQAPLQRHVLPALTLLGSLLNERGRPDEALAFEQRALETAEKTVGPDAPRLVRVLMYLAEIRWARGELAEALHVFERAARIDAAHLGDVERPTRAAMHRGYGRLLLSLGETEGARVELQAALDAAGDDATLSTERAATLVTLAETADAGDAQRRPRLEEALALYRTRLPEAHPAILRVINDLCLVEIDESPAGAPNCGDAAGRLEASSGADPSLREEVHLAQSRWDERRGDAEGFVSHAVDALAAASALGTPEPVWRASYRLAVVMRRTGRNAMAVFFGKRAIEEIQKLRGGFVGEDRRYDRGFLKDKVAVYRAVADWLMEDGRLDEGLEVLRLLKSEELYDFAMRDASFRSGDATVGMTDDERALADRFVAAVGADAAASGELDRLSRLRASGRLSVKERERLDVLLAGQRDAEAARAARIRVFLAESKPGAPGPAAANPASAARLAGELRRFGPDTALAIYLMTETHLRVLVATARTSFEARIPVDAPELRRTIGRFLDAIARRDDVTAASKALYDRLAKPVDDAARRAHAKRLVLSLDDALRYVPFGALNDGERYLGERYAITIDAGSQTPSSPPPPRRPLRRSAVSE